MSYPVCVVELYSATEQWTLTAAIDPREPYGVTPGSDLIRVSTEKHLHYARPDGRFHMSLTAKPDKQGRTWMDRLRPQDLVVIQFGNIGQSRGQSKSGGQGEMHTTMVGLIDQVSEQVGVSPGGVPQHEIQVMGRDFGKLFLHGNVTYWSFAGANIYKAAKFTLPYLLNAQPHEVIRQLLEQIFFRFMRPEWAFNSRTVRFEDVMAYALTSYQGFFPGGLDWQFLSAEEPFWSFFMKVASVPFHEVFIDTRRAADIDGSVIPGGLMSVSSMTPEGQFVDLSGLTPRAEPPIGSLIKLPASTFGQDRSSPALFLRPPPFPELRPDKSVNLDAWNKLRMHTISMKEEGLETQQRHLTKSDAEVFNLYLIYPRGSVWGQHQFLQYVPPIIDEARFVKYGYRPLIPQVSILKGPDTQSANDPWLQFYKKLAWALAGWNVMNDQFLSGTMTLPLSPHIHIGERVVDESSWLPAHGGQPGGHAFYVESVRHELTIGGRAQTMLGVTRGLPIREEQAYETTLAAAAQGLVDVGIDPVASYKRLVEDGQKEPT